MEVHRAHLSIKTEVRRRKKEQDAIDKLLGA
jgi:hypothetical protein